MSMQKICADPKTNIKFIKETMHSHMAALNKLLDLGIVAECHVVIEAQQRKDGTAEPMHSRINRHLFEKDTVLSDWRTDTTIEDISFKGARNTLCNIEEAIIPGKLVRAYQHRKCTSLHQSR